MKKLISILVVFAVLASAVIAQEGSWSVSGSGELGTYLNFAVKDANDDPAPTVGAFGYNRYGYYGLSTGTLGLTYSNGDLSAGLSFDQSDKIGANVSYNSGDIAFSAESSLVDLFEGNYSTGRLWGYYKLLDSKIHLEAALNSRDTNYWISNEVVGNVFDSTNIFISAFGAAVSESSPGAGDGAPARWIHSKYKFGIGWGFTSVDHHDYIVADFALIDGLSFGVMIPKLFASPSAADNGTKGTEILGGYRGADSYSPSMDATTFGQYYTIEWQGLSYASLKDAFQRTRFGVKYADGPLDAAVQFGLLGPNGADPDKLNTGLYVGANYSINDSMKAGVGLEGQFDGDDSDNNKFAFGVSFSYSAGAFNAKLEGGLYFGPKNGFEEKGVLGLRPHVSYNLVENYLCLSLDAFLFFNFDSDWADNAGLGYEITPELWFNVMGTGAGEGYYYPNATAIILRYKVGGFSEADDPAISALDLTFKFSF